MRILAVWDNELEAEQISLYLDVDENEVLMTTSPSEFRRAIESGQPVDILLMPTGLPDTDSAFALFELAQASYPESPIVGACPPTDVFRVVRFMANGMSAYVTRDVRGDYMFMLRAILESTLDAVRTAREKELTKKLREEVESVRKLQESVFPRNPKVPEGYAVCARYEPPQIRIISGQPVTMAGGDYYDIFTLADGSFALLVGDATGHGMKSCLSIMTLHTLVRMMRRQTFRDSAHFVEEINKGLCEQSLVTEKGGFITLLYVILDPNTHTLQWSAAGHHSPLLHDLTTNTIQPLGSQGSGGLPLAVDEDAEFEMYSCKLPVHCRILLYTDGLEEAYPDWDDSKHFGIPGIMKTLSESAEIPLAATLERLFDASNDFTEGSGRQDDTSIVLLERFSLPPS